MPKRVNIRLGLGQVEHSRIDANQVAMAVKREKASLHAGNIDPQLDEGLVGQGRSEDAVLGRRSGLGRPLGGWIAGSAREITRGASGNPTRGAANCAGDTAHASCDTAYGATNRACCTTGNA